MKSLKRTRGNIPLVAIRSSSRKKYVVYSPSEGQCRSVNGKMKCEEIQRIFRVCPRKRPVHTFVHSCF